jgi:hydrogenase maturation protease
VALLDLGTPGPEFVDYLIEIDTALVIDAVDAEGDAGAIKLYDRSEILSVAIGERLSPHDPSLREALLTAELAGRGPSAVVLVGVVPESTRLGTELSAAVRAAVPEIEDEVLRQLSELGIEGRRREVRGDPDIWWEQRTG